MIEDRSLTLGLLRANLEGRQSEGRVTTLLDQSGARGTATAGEVVRRAERLASALTAAGVRRHDRVATLSWNTQAHLEAYWAVPCMGAVLHTLNVRLTAEQLAAIAERAGDRVLLVHPDLADLGAELAALAPCVERVIVFGDEYEGLLSAQPEGYDWPELDEHEVAALCFTSGTEGAPKGVPYTHRMLVLHALTMAAFDPHRPLLRDTILAVVPMFHAMGWNLPYIAALTGADLVLPDRFIRPALLADVIVGERVTFSCGVPTVWSDVLAHVREHGSDVSSLRAIACGGNRVPRELMEGWERHGVHVLQGWGMTETGPGASRGYEEPGIDDDERWRRRTSAGRLRPLYEARVRAADGKLQPQDGVASGEIEVRGPLVITAYLENEEAQADRFRDGWLRTGDIGTIDPQGWIRILDREKDVVKSGGEWIPSLELEAALLEHPAVDEAAVIGVPDPRWMERPLAFVVGRETIPAPDVRVFLAGRVPTWWIPEEVVSVDRLPRTAVGKVDKRALRESLAALGTEGT